MLDQTVPVHILHLPARQMVKLPPSAVFTYNSAPPAFPYSWQNVVMMPEPPFIKTLKSPTSVQGTLLSILMQSTSSYVIEWRMHKKPWPSMPIATTWCLLLSMLMITFLSELTIYIPTELPTSSLSRRSAPFLLFTNCLPCKSHSISQLPPTSIQYSMSHNTRAWAP